MSACNHPAHEGRRPGRRRLLGECATGSRAVVVANTGARAMELGFYRGVSVQVLHNDPAAVSLVVLAGDRRFVVPRELAATVVVRLFRSPFWQRLRRRWRGGRGCHAQGDS